MKAFERHGIEKKTKCLTTRHKILMEILQTAPNISLLPLSLVDLTLFPHLCTVPLVEELTSDVADSGQSIILDQVENGVAVRMAVLYLLAGKRM